MTTHDDHPMTPELAAVLIDWDAAAQAARERLAPRPCAGCGGPAVHTINGKRWCNDCAPWPRAPRIHVTAQMIADIWQDGRREEVARILAALPRDERNRLETEYLKLLRARGHRIALRVVRRQFQLVIELPTEPVIERLAA